VLFLTKPLPLYSVGQNLVKVFFPLVSGKKRENFLTPAEIPPFLRKIAGFRPGRILAPAPAGEIFPGGFDLPLKEGGFPVMQT
jgi:hypothetical protein